MSPWIPKAIILIASLAMVIIRHPHSQRSRAIKVVKSRKGLLETVLLTLAWLGFLIPFVWIATPLFAFADYRPRPAPVVAGIPLLALGLWFFHRSHADLGTNFSITLEVRERHQLITKGIYRHIRHPMYLAFLVHSAGQALVLPNWIAGPWLFIAMALLIAVRLHTEERLMLDEFGEDYEAYRARTRRLIPGVW